MSDNTGRYQKLGGWLLCITAYYFLWLASIALQFYEGGAMDVLRRWDMLIGAQGLLLLAGQVVSLVQVVIYVFAAIAILQRDPAFLRTRQLAFVTIAVNLLLQLVYGFLYGFAQSGEFAIVLQAALYTLNFLLAMLYYTRSARVRAYMGSDEYLRLAFFTGRCAKKANNNTDGGDL